MLLNPLTYHVPKSIAEAAKLYNELESVKIQAGGTFLLNSLKLSKTKGTKTPDHILGLGQIEELKGILINNDELIIRAMTTIDDIFHSKELKENFNIFHTVCQNISTQPIRNMATIGGNLTCRYTWTEMPAVMLAFNATMVFIDEHNKEHKCLAEDFFKQNAKTGKIFSHIIIQKNKDTLYAYKRVSKTASVDIPLLSLLVSTKIKNGKFTNTRFGINNCVQFAQRDEKLENFLNASPCEEKTAKEALNHLTEEIYDTRSSDFKKHMFRVSIKNAINELIQKHNKK